nr:hypothetical protein CFP56_67040 [Quercus suber]
MVSRGIEHPAERAHPLPSMLVASFVRSSDVTADQNRTSCHGPDTRPTNSCILLLLACGGGFYVKLFRGAFCIYRRITKVMDGRAGVPAAWDWNEKQFPGATAGLLQETG